MLKEECEGVGLDPNAIAYQLTHGMLHIQSGRLICINFLKIFWVGQVYELIAQNEYLVELQ